MSLDIGFCPFAEFGDAFDEFGDGSDEFRREFGKKLGDEVGG